MKKAAIISLNILALTILTVLPVCAQTEAKVAVITVSGSGKTQDEARQNALRNAIEQAFGTFISSNTQILNDELVKDEIVSVSSGNIQEYDVLSEIQTSDGNWSNTVKAKVALEKLTSFCESKGVTADLKGALFAINVKQQMLNEQNEIEAIKNMCFVLKQISEQAFNYSIEVGDPSESSISYQIPGWSIPVKISVTANNSFKIISDYLGSTLKGLTMSIGEVESYVKIGKEVHPIAFVPNDYKLTPVSAKKKKSSGPPDNIIPAAFLRRDESVSLLCDFISYFRKSVLNFVVENNITSIQGIDIIKGTNKNNWYAEINDSYFRPVFLWNFGQRGIFEKDDFPYKPIKWKEYNDGLGNTGFNLRYLNNYGYSDPQYFFEKNPVFQYLDYNSLSVLGNIYDRFELVILLNDIPAGKQVITISYKETFTLEQLSKITGYQIKQRISGYEVDQDGQLFKTTWIGNQRWMAQDLNVIHFSNGEPVTEISYREQEKWNGTNDPAMISDDDDYNLYNWYTIIDKRNICPAGWHVPSEAEWAILTEYLGGKEVAGGKLKGVKDSRYYREYWKTPNVGATDEYLFTSVPTVRFGRWGLSPNWLEDCGYWVFSDLNSNTYGKCVKLFYNSAELKSTYADVHEGLSIRCIKD